MAAARLPDAAPRCTQLAAEHDLPQENLLSPDAVRRLAWRPPDPLSVETVTAFLTEVGARPWQVDLTAAALTAALPTQD